MIKCGIIGAGYISASHVEAVRRLGNVETAAIADVNTELAAKKASEFHIPKFYGNVDDLLADSDIQVIHNCTPNNLHYEINEKTIKTGKHLISEKPLAKNSVQTKKLLETIKKYPGIVTAVNYNYRMNPLVQEMKARVLNGEIGKPKFVHGSYLQDWLLYETDYSWRMDPEISGLSNCVADIGSHWMDMAQYVTNAKITEVCADLVITRPIRKKPKKQVEAFAINNDVEYDDVEIVTEDYGSVLFKMDNGTHGVYLVSQVSAGRKCYFNFEVNGDAASFYWNQENADQMWMGFRDKPNQLIMRNPNLMPDNVKKYTYLAAGHPEGWNDAFTNNIKAFYNHITKEKSPQERACDFATFQEAHYIMLLVEAILESNKTKGWVKINV